MAKSKHRPDSAPVTISLLPRKLPGIVTARQRKDRETGHPSCGL